MKYPMVVCFGLLSTIGWAQDDEKKGFFKYLENQVSVRKAFDGSKNEKIPASFSWNRNFETEDQHAQADLAIKLTIKEFVNKNSLFEIYPKFEWHKNTLKNKEQDKLSGGINLEYIPVKQKTKDGDGWILAPYLIGTTSFKRNLLEKVDEQKFTLQTTFASKIAPLPGSMIRYKSGEFLARYYPYFGLEYYRLPDLIVEGEEEEVQFFYLRLYTELWIWPRVIQLVGDGSLRTNLTRNSDLDDHYQHLSLASNLYFGDQDHYSLGLEWETGQDHENKFETTNMLSIKLNVKY